nr:hypothetical protein [Bradyrhizobium elkanii]
MILHYLKLILVIVPVGSVLGIAAGWGFGKAMTSSYRGFFRLPELPFGLTPWSAALGIAISLTAASLGVLTALRQVVRLAPSVAMRPAAPLGFRRSWIEALLPRTATRSRRLMILRNTAGRPFRSLLTVTGVAFAIPMMVLGISWRDAINEMIDLQFSLVERGNTTVTFPHPMDRSIIRDLARELSRPGNEHAHHGPPYRDRRRCSGCRCGDGLAVGPGAGGGRDRCGDEGTVHRHRR